MKTFIELQGDRHDADYNHDRQWNRSDVESLLAAARRAFADWSAVRRTPNATVFLASLLPQKQWGR